MLVVILSLSQLNKIIPSSISYSEYHLLNSDNKTKLKKNSLLNDYSLLLINYYLYYISAVYINL